MCIIVIKPSDTPMPSRDTLENCFINNPHGAGIMYTKNEKVIINKGLMSEKSFFDTLDKIERIVDTNLVPMIFHFRIGTHGGKNQGNTHPFPISDEKEILQKSNNVTNVGICHNGIIHLCEKTVNDMSDTMMFIADYITYLYKSNPEFYRDENILQIINNMTNSKFAFLDKYGNISVVGKYDKVDGIYYSNSTYQNYYNIMYPTYNYDISTKYVRVMHLKYKDYAISNFGEIITNEHCNLYMDCDYNLYIYDIMWDVIRKKEGFKAVNKKGYPLKFDDEFIEMFPLGT